MSLVIDYQRTAEISFEHIVRQLESDDAGVYTARLGEHVISSHFQPIFSLSHRRHVGHEALMRPRTTCGKPLVPPELIDRLSHDFYALLELDRLCRALHIANFSRLSSSQESEEWLFINMHPEVFLRAPHLSAHDVLSRQLLSTFDVSAHRVVIEVVEEAVADKADFASAVAFFREIGCLIALDDFGAGHSNFDRIWSIRPEIVKLDRSLLVEARREKHVRHMLPQMVSLLHEAGALVLMEGIETQEEAYIALEADIDFVQGFHLGMPEADLFASDDIHPPIGAIWNDFDQRWRREQFDYQRFIEPYVEAMDRAARLLEAGQHMDQACGEFLRLECSEFCYLLDAQGHQIGFNHWAKVGELRRDPRFSPMLLGEGARWARRPYFRRAIENFGEVQITRPYLSITSGLLCVTLSASLIVDGELQVLCGDVRWDQR